MTKAIDPFEEYLRKKKVEMMEQKLREPVGEKSSPALESVPEPDPDEDPEASARLTEEMADFFESGQQAGAELFNQMQGLEEERVEEIKDALDEVFEEDAPVPQTEEGENNFVEFFQQVETEFDGDERPKVTAAELVDEPKPMPKPEPPPAPPKAAPAAAAPAAAAPAAAEPATPAPASEPVVVELDDLPGPGNVEMPSLTLEPDPVDLDSLREEGRLNLADILLNKDNGADLEQRVEVLCRLVSRLVEKARLPESEIIEALIRADVEF